MSGTGTITACGGSGSFSSSVVGGGGGGGRIAIHSYNTFQGTVKAYGGSSANNLPGGPGTIYFRTFISEKKTLIIDNNNYNALAYDSVITNPYTNTPLAWIFISFPIDFDWLNITRQGGLAIKSENPVSFCACFLSLSFLFSYYLS